MPDMEWSPGAAYGIWRKFKPSDFAPFIFPMLWIAAILLVFKIIAGFQTVTQGQWPFQYRPAYFADFLFPVLLFSLAMALAPKFSSERLSALAKYSFGIYLCHPIFLDIMEIVLRDQGFSPSLQVAAKICVAIPATALLVWLLSKSRFLGWTVGLGPLPLLRKPRHVGSV